MLIGLTGPNAAGKGAVAGYLKKKRFSYLSLSDVLRDELRFRGRKIDREALFSTGNELRQSEGPGVLAERVLERTVSGRSYIIDSIRHPAEVASLRKRSDFFLIVVDAPTDTRFERIKQRKREKDPTTFDGFLDLEEREMAGKEDDHQQLARTITLADYVIDNNGSFKELGEKVDRMVSEIESRCTE